jgi:hypothetical protein
MCRDIEIDDRCIDTKARQSRSRRQERQDEG